MQSEFSCDTVIASLRRGQGSEMEALRHCAGVLLSKCAVISIANCPGLWPHGLSKYALSAINITWQGNLTTIKLEGLQDVFKTKIKGEISAKFCKGRPAVALVHVLALSNEHSVALYK